MDTVTQVQFMDEVACFSHHSNTLGKGKHSNFLSPAMG